MTTLAMKPIRFDRCQVALMVKVADYFHPNFATQVGEMKPVINLCIRMIAKGCMDPNPQILNFFCLRKDGDGFVWEPAISR